MATLPATAAGEVRLTLRIPNGDGTDAPAQGYAYLRPRLKPGTVYRASNVDPLTAADVRLVFDGSGNLEDPETSAWPKVLASDAPGINVGTGDEPLQYELELHLTGFKPTDQPFVPSFTVPAQSFVNVGLIAPDATVQLGYKYVFLSASGVTTLVQEATSAVAALQADVDAAVAAVPAAATTAVNDRLDVLIPRQIGQRQSPFADASRTKWRRAYNKKANGPANGDTFTVFEAEGAGIIHHFWYAVAGSGYPMFDLRIRVYVDGSPDPCIDTDLGSWGGYIHAPNLPQGSVHSSFWYAKCAGGGAQTHGGSRVLLPYSHGIRIEFVNPGEVAGSYIFSQVDYASEDDNPDMVIPPFRLYGESHGIAAGMIAVAEDANERLHTLNGEGILVRHTMAAMNFDGTYTVSTTGDGTGLAYLERHISVSIDGETTPSIKSSGMEDWFGGSFYYNGEMPFSYPLGFGFGSQAGGYFTSNQTLDLLGMQLPIRYDYGCEVDWEANLLSEGPRSPAAVASFLAYYRRVPDTVTDLFDRPDSTSGIGVAPNEAAWENSVGVWGIVGGEAYNASNTGDAIALLPVHGSDHVSVTVTFGSVVGSNPGIVIGANGNDCYIYNCAARTMFKKVNGTSIGVGGVVGGTSPVPGDVFTLVKQGPHFTAYQNGVEIGSIDDDATISGGARVGLFAPTNATRFASIAVEPGYTPQVLPLTDTFERANTTLGIGTAPNGSVWENGVGTWGIVGGEAYNASNTSDAIALIATPTTAPQTVSFTYGSVVGQNSGLIIGAVDANNCYIYNAYAHAMYKKVDGVITAVPSTPGGTVPVAGDEFTVVKSGNSFTAYQNGVEVGTIDDDSSVVGGTKAGLFAPADVTRFASFTAA